MDTGGRTTKESIRVAEHPSGLERLAERLEATDFRKREFDFFDSLDDWTRETQVECEWY